MAKRVKRIEKGVESLKKEIEKHFSKLEEDIEAGKVELGRYHVKEIDKSLLRSLEIKLEFLGGHDRSVETYRERLNKLKKKLIEE